MHFPHVERRSRQSTNEPRGQQQLRDAYPELEYKEGDEYWRYLRQLRVDDDGNEDPTVTQLFLTYYKRAAISYEAASKLKLAPQLIDLLVSKAHKKVLVFFERIWTAEFGQDDLVERVAKRVQDQLRGTLDDPIDDPIWCKLYHSKIPDKERVKVMEEFRSIGPSALLACRSLDEGLDVPAVDAAILVASTQSSRQRLQRIGRTLRRGDGRKRPLILILYVRGTSDSNIAISANDADFKDAATVYDTDARSVMLRVQELAGLVDAKPEPKTAAAIIPPTKVAARPEEAIQAADYTWIEKTTPGMGTGRIEVILRNAVPMNAAVKLELAGGRQITGLKLGMSDQAFMLSKPARHVDVEKIKRIWVGSRTSRI